MNKTIMVWFLLTHIHDDEAEMKIKTEILCGLPDTLGGISHIQTCIYNS